MKENLVLPPTPMPQQPNAEIRIHRVQILNRIQTQIQIYSYRNLQRNTTENLNSSGKENLVLPPTPMLQKYILVQTKIQDRIQTQIQIGTYKQL